MGCFQVMYDSRVVIYERKLFIRLPTELYLLTTKLHIFTTLESYFMILGAL